MGAVSRYNASTRPRSYTERKSLRRSEALGVKLERIDGPCGTARQSRVASAPGNESSSLARRSVRHLGLDGGMARGATRGFDARGRPRTSTTSVKAAAHQREGVSVHWPVRQGRQGRQGGFRNWAVQAGRNSFACCSVLRYLGFADTKSISHLLCRALPPALHDNM